MCTFVHVDTFRRCLVAMDMKVSSRYSAVCGILSSLFPLMIYDIYSMLAVFVAACYSLSDSGVLVLLKVSLIDFCCSNIFIIILYNIIDHGETWRLDNAKGDVFELESPCRMQFS